MKSWQIALGSFMVVALIASGFLTNFFIGQSALRNSQHAWCTIITLSLAGVQPSKLHGKEQRDYNAIVMLGDDYGCL